MWASWNRCGQAWPGTGHRFQLEQLMFHLLLQGAHALRSIADVEKHVQDTYPQQIADEAIKEAREVIKVWSISKFGI